VFDGQLRRCSVLLPTHRPVDKSRLVYTGISAGISENRIFRCLPVFIPKREKNLDGEHAKILYAPTYFAIISGYHRGGFGSSVNNLHVHLDTSAYFTL
jgi:hypothetical protein